MTVVAGNEVQQQFMVTFMESGLPGKPFGPLRGEDFVSEALRGARAARLMALACSREHILRGDLARGSLSSFGCTTSEHVLKTRIEFANVVPFTGSLDERCGRLAEERRGQFGQLRQQPGSSGLPELPPMALRWMRRRHQKNSQSRLPQLCSAWHEERFLRQDAGRCR